MIASHILIDFHGVLTDGKQSISHDGTFMFDHIHTRDVRAIRELVARGFIVVILTASSNPVIEHFARKVGAEICVARDKSVMLDRFGFYVGVGDDVWDLQMLKQAERCFCPGDADPLVKEIEGIEILDTAAGRGCLAEILPKLC
jgi:3-deoxy-D-manno-octulosonate 8-phosphate phosphatase KdsC-like HAD superfamily phosphatase